MMSAACHFGTFTGMRFEASRSNPVTDEIIPSMRARSAGMGLRCPNGSPLEQGHYIHVGMRFVMSSFQTSPITSTTI